MQKRRQPGAPPPLLRAPLRNTGIADRFDNIATTLELAEANPFRVRAYRNASRLLRRYGKEIGDLLVEGANLAELPFSLTEMRSLLTRRRTVVRGRAAA
jgi:hypothetical protein